MNRFAFLLALPLAACATVGAMTPGQNLFAADGLYGSALHAARVYSDQPQASAQVIHLLNTANKAALPAHELVIAYKACVVNKATSVYANGVITQCTVFDFSNVGLTNAAVALRNAALKLQQETPK